MVELLYIGFVIGILAVVHRTVGARKVLATFTAFSILDAGTTAVFMLNYGGGNPSLEANTIARNMMVAVGIIPGLAVYIIVSVGVIWLLQLLSEGSIDGRLVYVTIPVAIIARLLGHYVWILVLVWLLIYAAGQLAKLHRHPIAEFPIILYAALMGGMHITGALSWIEFFWGPTIRQALPWLG